MRQAWLWSWIGLLLVIVLLPAFLVRGCNWSSPPARGGGAGAGAANKAGVLSGAASGASGLKVRLFVTGAGRLETLDLEDYVRGVVAAEMPSTFHDEALKAQAVLARTYALKRMRVFGGAGCEAHAEADLCTGVAFQEYTTLPELQQKIGKRQAEEYWRRVDRAVQETRGLMLSYEGAPIEAVYHSTSAGKTEDAQEVFGQSFPYLKPVPSDDRSSPRYQDELRISLRDLAARLGETALAAPASTPGAPLVQVIDRTAGDRVRNVRIGTKVLNAVELRRLMGLRSTQFTARVEGDQAIFTTKGYGHGVGMSQFGANDLAKSGNTYTEILQHYYPGVTLGPIFGE